MSEIGGVKPCRYTSLVQRLVDEFDIALVATPIADKATPKHGLPRN
jgi:hypothetical protein